MPQSVLTRFKAAERRAIVMDLARKSLSFDQIAQALHQQYPTRTPPYYDKSHAHRDVQWCLKNIREKLILPTEEKRQLESERYDNLRAVYALKALQGDHKALDSLLRIMDKYALLHGLYKAPKRDDVLTVDAVMPLLDMVNRAWNDAALALLTPEQQDALFSMVQQRLEATAAAGQSMQALLSGGSEPASSEETGQ